MRIHNLIVKTVLFIGIQSLHMVGQSTLLWRTQNILALLMLQVKLYPYFCLSVVHTIQMKVSAYRPFGYLAVSFILFKTSTECQALTQILTTGTQSSTLQGSAVKIFHQTLSSQNNLTYQILRSPSGIFVTMHAQLPKTIHQKYEIMAAKHQTVQTEQSV